MNSPEEFYSKNSEQFAEEYSIENMPEAYKKLLDAFAEKVKNGKVLDAGCGSGRDTEYLTKKGLETIGIDLAEGMIQHAKKNKKGQFQIMNIKDLEFKNQTFDGIWCNTVIHFFPPKQMPKIIKELKRVLKPQGTIYISFKIGKGTFTRKDYGDQVKQYLIPKQKAKQMLKNQNLQIKETKEAEVKNTKIINIIAKAKK